MDSNQSKINLTFVEPIDELKPFIQSIWVFESSVGMPLSDSSLAAPNGCSKIIINYENTIHSTAEGRINKSREHSLYFAGTRDVSVQISTPPGKTGFIGIEFYPHGAYPIFGIPMVETANSLLPAEAIFSDGRDGRTINEALANLKSVSEKINFIQNQLVKLLRRRQLQNSVIEFCVGSLKSTNGLITISELECKTGYTGRYIELLFKNHVGFSPKVLAGIFRFQKFYKKWAHGVHYNEFKDELYNYYYDQAHFTKEFKKMTGFAPRHFIENVSNEFGRRLTLH